MKRKVEQSIKKLQSQAASDDSIAREFLEAWNAAREHEKNCYDFYAVWVAGNLHDPDRRARFLEQAAAALENPLVAKGMV